MFEILIKSYLEMFTEKNHIFEFFGKFHENDLTFIYGWKSIYFIDLSLVGRDHLLVNKVLGSNPGVDQKPKISHVRQFIILLFFQWGHNACLIILQGLVYGSFGHLSTKIWKISNRYPGMRVHPFSNLKNRLFLDILGAAMLLSRFLVWFEFT